MKNIGKIYNTFLCWVIGKKAYNSQMKELPNYLAFTLNLITILISVVYLTIDIVQGYYEPLIAHFILLFGCFLGILLTRVSRIEYAKILVLFLFNAAIYVTVAAESYETASHLYFFTTAFAAFVVFDYKNLGIAIGFAILSYVLYLFATLSDFTILPEFNFSPETVKLFFIFNVSIFMLITMAIVMLYIRMIHVKNLEVQEQNLKLKQTNSELDQFLYSTSHDLRAPLASVLGLLNVLENTSDIEEIKKYHKLMRNRVEKMDDFINDIIDLIKNSRLPLSNERLNINKMVEEIFSNLKFQTGVQSIVLNNKIPDEFEVSGDKVRLSIILNNLISNAIKYSDRNKDECKVEVTGKINGQMAHLSVIDNGIGIEKNQMDKIFEMFYRASEVSTGAGLGLYITNEAVKTLNGEIQVNSQRGVGTTFQLSIPK